MKMAWRNIWRNPRRTLVILTAVFIGVTSMVFLAALMKGMVFSMVENSLYNLTGHVLVRDADFVADPTIVNRLKGIDKILTKVKAQLPEGGKALKRIRLDGFLNTARDSVGVNVVATDLDAEKGVSFIGDIQIDGLRLDNSDKGSVLIGYALSKKIGLSVGKKFVLSMQGTDGELIARSFRIKGIFHTGQEEIEKSVIIMPYIAAEKMLSIDGDGTEIVVDIPISDFEKDDCETLANKINNVMPDSIKALSWKDVIPAVSAYLTLYSSFMYIWYLIVFIAMGFGIVNTVLMAVYERMREFGLLRAMGARSIDILRMVLTEVCLLIIIGLVAGNIVAYIMISVMSSTGLDLSAYSSGMDMINISRIIYPVLTFGDLVKADLTVLALGMAISFYPACKACSFSPVETMRNV